MDLFARISATKARFYLPISLKSGKTTEHVRMQLRYVSAMMTGRIPVDEEDGYSEEDKEQVEFQDWLDEEAESRLQFQGAEIARDKLDVMTQRGRMRLTQGQWEDFVEVWSPHFEKLMPKDFKGKYHYVYEDDPWGSA